MELLKQPLCRPLKLHEQVITLILANRKFFVETAPEQVKELQMNILEYFDEKHADVGLEIEEKKELTDDIVKRILEVAEEYKSRC